MNCLELQIQKSKKRGTKLFCAYVTLGYPNVKFTEQLIPALEEAGVDILELGIPFSDPLADGPAIQEASYVSLMRKTKIQDAFTVVKKMRLRGVTMPIVFFSYYNPIFHIGIKKCAAQLKESGFDGVLCPDLPPDEISSLGGELKKRKLSLIYLIAPTTVPSRIKLIAERSQGFIYYVARRGVTGVHAKIADDLFKNVRQIKRYTRKSVLVGFGVSDEKQIKRILSVSDGVIVGSAIINTIKSTRSVRKTANYVRRLVRAVKGG
ncbi:MAG: tryptophan synthase subunit alpha [Candidatus Omnitrophica bacterium]|nr:tryptophan synthase subunit alpha [Candidatus Omnitrophota bacterium]